MANLTKRFMDKFASISEERKNALITLLEAIGTAEQDDEPAPRRPGRPAKNSAKRTRSQENDDQELDAPKRGRGRPRKDDSDNSEKRGRGRPRKDEKPARNSSAKKPAAKKAAAPRAVSSNDYSEMSRSELRGAAQKMGLDTHAAKINDANLSKALIAIDKLANGAKSVDAWEKQAKREKIELVFGRGRPPATDEGLKRRIIVKLVNERALRV